MGVKYLSPGLLLFIFLLSIQLSAQNESYTLSSDSLVNFYAGQKRVYYATRTQLKPKIDGKLTDPCWQLGAWSGGFRQQQPHQAQKPSQETEINILYDDRYLYVGIKCFDRGPGKIRPILGRRDDYNYGDVAGIALDTYFDKRTAFEFNVTAAGQKIDLMHLGAYQWDTNWDAVWAGKSFVGDSLWTAEMAIPFNQVRFAKKDDYTWGMHVWRWIDRLDEEDQWKLIPIDAPAMVYIFGELKGIKGIQTKRNFEIMPYGKTKYISGTSNNDRFGFGLDGKIGVSSDFTLDYTVNPDFGQVEADPSELNLTSYEVFYDEKRPFFLEGNSILDYSIGNDLLFYSRRIGHAPSYTPEINDNEELSMPENTSIINALKLTGKNKNGFSLGIINSMTAKEFGKISGQSQDRKEVVEPFTDYFIGRLKQDYNNGNTVLGGMFTSTLRSIKNSQLLFLPEKSLIGGIDFQHNWKNRKYFVNFKAFYSNLSGDTTAIKKLQKSSVHLYNRIDAPHLEFDPNRTSLDGWGGEISGGKQSGKFRVTERMNWRSPGVDLNDVGYLRQADYLRNEFTLKYQVNEPKGIIRSYYFTTSNVNEWSFGGENTYNKFANHGYVKFSNLWSLHLILDRLYNVHDTRQLRGGPALRIDDMTSLEYFIQTNSTKDFFVGVGSNWYLYDKNYSQKQEYTFYLSWQILNNISFSSNTVFTKNLDNNQYVFQKRIGEETRYIVGKINRETLFTTLRLEYFITPELSLQIYGSPYASTGKFLDFRKVANSNSKDVDKRFLHLPVIEKLNGKVYVDDNYDGKTDFDFNEPDFDFREFRSNFVARWEFKPGSTLYFVWTHNRTQDFNTYNESILNSFKGIFHVKPQNAFMLKLSYWFSL